MKQTPCEIHVVSHTHWDREWRFPFAVSKIKLMDCLDNVIKLLETDPDFHHFMCDGQMIMVDDYLDYRPEKRKTVERLAREGKLVLGPWYSLIDEFLSSGESVVRNMLAGYRAAEAMGASQKIGYCPASFGHISQIPQIVSGFGFDTAIFSRGLSSEAMPDMEYIWEGADGTQVLAAHMVEDSTKSNFTKWVYLPSVTGHMADLEPQVDNVNGIPFILSDMDSAPKTMFYALNPFYKVDVDVAYERVLKLKEYMLTRCKVPVLLFLDGVDQMEASPYVTELINKVNERLAETTGDKLVHSTLEKYFDALKEKTGWDAESRKSRMDLKSIKGEMRYPNKLTTSCGFFGAVAMARMYQHKRNEICENLLERWAEPMACFAAIEGKEYPTAPLREAWQYIYANHTHDCLPGCARDEVHDNVMHRYDQIEQISRDVLERSLMQLSTKTDLSAYGDQELALIVYNSLPFERSETVTAFIDFPSRQWVDDFVILDGDKEIPFQSTTRHTAYRLLVKYLDLNSGIPLQRFKVTFRAEDIPSMGYKTFKVKYAYGNQPGGHIYKDKLARKYPGRLVTARNTMENEHLRVAFNLDGTFTLTHKATGREYKDQHYFEDACMGGDIWSPVSPGVDLGVVNTLSRPARIQLVEDGPAIATYRVEYELSLPVGLDKETQTPKPERRTVTLVSEISLRAGSRRLDITTKFDNVVEDHMLRVMFPTDLQVEESAAEGQFDVVKRPVVKPHLPDFVEPPEINHPQQGFVDASDGNVGLGLLNEGLRAFQLLDDERRTLSMVLIRSVNAPGVAALVQKGAQCQGPQEFRYAVCPHEGDWEKGDLFKEARMHNLGLKIVNTTGHAGELPETLSFVRVVPENLVLSAVKPAEDGGKTILRFWNPSDKAISSKLEFYRDVSSVQEVNLNEQPVCDLKVKDGKSVEVAVGAKKIITLAVDVA